MPPHNHSNTSTQPNRHNVIPTKLVHHSISHTLINLFKKIQIMKFKLILLYIYIISSLSIVESRVRCYATNVWDNELPYIKGYPIFIRPCINQIFSFKSILNEAGDDLDKLKSLLESKFKSFKFKFMQQTSKSEHDLVTINLSDIKGFEHKNFPHYLGNKIIEYTILLADKMLGLDEFMNISCQQKDPLILQLAYISLTRINLTIFLRNYLREGIKAADIFTASALEPRAVTKELEYIDDWSEFEVINKVVAMIDKLSSMLDADLNNSELVQREPVRQSWEKEKPIIRYYVKSFPLDLEQYMQKSMDNASDDEMDTDVIKIHKVDDLREFLRIRK
jgi:hypothetical protein